MASDSKKHRDRLAEMHGKDHRFQYLCLLQGYQLADRQHKEYQRQMEEWLDNIYNDYLRGLRDEKFL